MDMPLLAIRATETWSLGNVAGGLLLLAVILFVVVRSVRVRG